mmetsp:Transcript_25783/g.45466  ORF Transcript_25783/g.45466 Transcript_25783/m.45466 type:complete len:269 (-) Transcript_25783:50-856(-)
MRSHNRLSQRGGQSRSHCQQRGMLDLITKGLEFIRFHVVASVIDRLVLADDADITVRSRSKIIEDTCPNRTLNQLDRLRLFEIFPPARFKDSHGSQGTRSHRRVVQFGRASMRMDLIHGRAVNVTASQDQGSADVTLVLEETSFQHGAGRDDSRWRVRVHAKQLELTANQLSDHFRVGGCTGSATVHVGCQVVDLFAILFGDFRTTCGTSICSQNDSVLVNQPNNGRSRLLGGGESLRALQGQQVLIAEGLVKGKARRSRRSNIRITD